MEKKTVNILGTEYQIIKKTYADEPTFAEKHIDGFAIVSKNKLCIVTLIHLKDGMTNQRKLSESVKKKF